MDAAHRHIELQSTEDFAYLVDNVRRAAAESVAAAFPPVEDKTTNNKNKSKRKAAATNGDSDDLHARVEVLVNEYIQRTFALAAPNLTINGLPVDPVPYWDDDGGQAARAAEKDEPAFEPFDPRKRQRVEDLARDEEDLLRDIAALKRRVPPAAVRAHARRLEVALAVDEAAAAAAATAAEEALEGGGDELPTGGDMSASADTFAAAVAGLGRLKQAMPATVARMERARVAGTYAMTER